MGSLAFYGDGGFALRPLGVARSGCFPRRPMYPRQLGEHAEHLDEGALRDGLERGELAAGTLTLKRRDFGMVQVCNRHVHRLSPPCATTM